MKNVRKLFVLAALLLPVALTSTHSTFENVRVLATTENHDVFIGDTIEVETRRLTHNDEYKDVKGLIYNPNGDSFEGRSFTITEPGLYKVVYQAYFGHHKEEQVINYLCKRKSENFFTITNPVDISFGEYRYNTADYHHGGVLIDVKNGTEVKFNEPLSVEDFMAEQNISPGKGYKDRSIGATAHPLISFLVDPSSYLSTDFTAMTIRLTDSVDKSNFVDIKIEDGKNSGDPRSGSMSYVRVGASCNWQLGWEWDESNPAKNNQGKFHNGISGTGLNLSFRGQPYNDNIVSAQLLYCAKNARFYNYLGSLETEHAYFINDLSDPIVYGNSVWEGFNSGKFYLSIIPTSFSNATGRLLVKSVGKYVLNSEILVDDIAPEITVDTQGYDARNLPRAVVGRRYPVFKASVFDNYDSNLNYDVSVTYRDTVNRQDIDVSLSEDSFMVNKAGVYTIKYDAKDKSGNIANTISLKVMTVGTFDDVVLSLLNTETTIDAYEDVSIPNASEVNKTGGIGNVVIERKVIDPSGNEISVTGDSFRPTLVGDYQIKFIGTDYIGNTGETTFIIHSQALSAPKFINEPNLPPALIKGFKYSFDKIKAINTVDGKVVEVTPEILVNDSSYTGQYKATGTSTKITYKADTTIKDINLDVVDVSNSEGGFDHSKYFVSGVYTAEETTYKETPNVKISGNSQGYSEFINKLNPDAFYMGLSLIEGETNMDVISVKLVDSKDKNIHITFDINIEEGTIQAPYLPELPFALYGEKIGLEYNDQNRTFVDTNQNSLGTIIKDDNGNPFNGFSCGIYLSIGFKEITGASSIAVEKICNQPIGYRNKGKDRIQPTIRYNSQFISEQEKGQQFVYPTFEAFDVLSDIDTATISIVKPNGSTINGNKDMTQTFVIEEVGEYRITYHAKDSSGNIKKVIEIISIYDDVKPTIVVNNPPKESYDLNASFQIPSYTANDESGIYTVDVILILPTNEMRILTHHIHNEGEGIDTIEYALDPERQLYDSSFIVNNTTCKLQMTGKYRIRFVVYDGAYNTTTVEYSFQVK